MVVELKQDDSVRSYVVISLAVYFLFATPIWWLTTYNTFKTTIPDIPDFEQDKAKLFTVTFIPLNESIELNGLQREGKRVYLDLGIPGDLNGAEELATSGDFRDFLVQFEKLPEPEAGTYNVLVVLEQDYNMAMHKGIQNEIRPCSRNQLVVLDSPGNLQVSQDFLHMMIANLSHHPKEPAFGLDGELSIRFTMLAIKNASIDSDSFYKNYEKSFAPLSDALYKIIPVKTTIQTRLMQSFAEPPFKDAKQGFHYFDEAQVTTLMRSGAWNIDLTIKNKNFIDFILIYTEPNEPIYIRDSTGALSKSVLYPNWGGAYFYNANDSENPFDAFSSQLLDILGVQHTKGCSAISPFDQDRFMHSVYSANSMRIGNAVSAFSDLMAKSPFLEINKGLFQSLSKWTRSTWHLIHALDARSLVESFHLSATCAKYAEQSFFHPSLLGRMYFPDEHKYAVYLPLLLPSILPVAFGLLKIFYGRIRRKDVTP